MKLLKWVVFFLILGSGITPTFASDGAASFTERAMEASAVGMGNAYSTLANGCDAVYWNPANLSSLQTFEVMGMGHRALETDFIAGGIAGKLPFINLPIGLRFQTAGLTGIAQTVYSSSLLRYVPTGAQDSYLGTLVGLATGFSLTPDLDMGVGLKLVRETTAGYSAQGLGGDVGFRYKPFRQWVFAFVAENVMQPIMVWNTPSSNRDTVRQRYRLGASYAVTDRLILTSEWITGSIHTWGVGGQWTIHECVPIRAGFYQGRLTLGTGLRLGSWELAIAWIAPVIEETEDMYRFSVKLNY